MVVSRFLNSGNLPKRLDSCDQIFTSPLTAIIRIQFTRLGDRGAVEGDYASIVNFEEYPHYASLCCATSSFQRHAPGESSHIYVEDFRSRLGLWIGPSIERDESMIGAGPLACILQGTGRYGRGLMTRGLSSHHLISFETFLHRIPSAIPAADAAPYRPGPNSTIQ